MGIAENLKDFASEHAYVICMWVGIGAKWYFNGFGYDGA